MAFGKQREGEFKSSGDYTSAELVGVNEIGRAEGRGYGGQDQTEGPGQSRDAIAQEVGKAMHQDVNIRATALKMANEFKASTPDQVVKRAEAYHTFLMAGIVATEE